MRIQECREHEFWNIGLSATAIKCLVSCGYETLDDLRLADNKDLLKIRGLGKVGIGKIREYTSTDGPKIKLRINALIKKRDSLLLDLDEIDNELKQLYTMLED